MFGTRYSDAIVIHDEMYHLVQNANMVADRIREIQTSGVGTESLRKLLAQEKMLLGTLAHYNQHYVEMAASA